MSVPSRATIAADTLEDLPAMCRRARARRGLSIRQAADQIGLIHTSVQRLEQGDNVKIRTVLAVLRWIESGDERVTEAVHVRAESRR